MNSFGCSGCRRLHSILIFFFFFFNGCWGFSVCTRHLIPLGCESTLKLCSEKLRSVAITVLNLKIKIISCISIKTFLLRVWALNTKENKVHFPFLPFHLFNLFFEARWRRSTTPPIYTTPPPGLAREVTRSKKWSRRAVLSFTSPSASPVSSVPSLGGV